MRRGFVNELLIKNEATFLLLYKYPKDKMMRRFFAFFSANSFARVYPEPNKASESKQEEPPTLNSLERDMMELCESHRIHVENYVKTTETALSFAIEKGSLKDTDIIVVETRKHLEEIKEMK